MEDGKRKIMIALLTQAHRAIKAKAAMEGKSIQQKVEELILADLEKEGE